MSVFSLGCGHQMVGFSYKFSRDEDPEDFAYIKDKLGLDDSVVSIGVCSECGKETPSERRRLAGEEQARIDREDADREELDEKIREARESGQKLFKCPSCEELFYEEELIQVRHCSHCEVDFDGTNEGRNCPDCNRPFTSKVIENMGCPECIDESAECEEFSIPQKA